MNSSLLFLGLSTQIFEWHFTEQIQIEIEIEIQIQIPKQQNQNYVGPTGMFAKKIHIYAI